MMKRWILIALACIMMIMMASCTGNTVTAPDAQPNDVNPSEATPEVQPTATVEPPDEAAVLAVYAEYTQDYPFEEFPLHEMMRFETFGYTITDMDSLGFGELYTFTYFVDKSVDEVETYYKDLAGAEAVGRLYSIDGYTLQVFVSDYSGRSHVTVLLAPPASDIEIVNESMAGAFAAQEPLMAEEVAEMKVLSNGIQLTQEAYFYHRGYDANAEGLGAKLKAFYEEQLKGTAGYEVNGDETNWTVTGEHNGYKMEAGFSYGIFTLTTWYEY